MTGDRVVLVEGESDRAALLAPAGPHVRPLDAVLERVRP
jgi:hypothetical protein